MKSFITSLVLEIAAALDEAKFLFKLSGILLFINKSYFKLKRFGISELPVLLFADTEEKCFHSNRHKAIIRACTALYHCQIFLGKRKHISSSLNGPERICNCVTPKTCKIWSFPYLY